MTFTTEEVVFLQAFMKQFIRKLGTGEFQDVMNRLYDDFRREVERQTEDFGKEVKPF